MGQDIASARIPRGKGYHNTLATIASGLWNTELEGTVRVFEDEIPQSGTTPAYRRSNRSVTCVLVRNDCTAGSGGDVTTGALRPKRCVTWKATYVGKRVDGYARVGHALGVAPDDIAGVVDEYFNAAGVPIGELFWLVVKGPTAVKAEIPESGTAWAVGDPLIAATAATSGATTSGRLAKYVGTFAVTDTTDGTAYKTQRFTFARALAAKITNTTGGDVLVEVDSRFRG